MRPVSTNACQAVSGDCAAAAASSCETFSGLRARCSAGTAANSHRRSRPGEIDRSEDRIADAELLDASPVFDTTPERSHPRIIGLCRRRESAIPPPRRVLTSIGFTPAAFIVTSTSPLFGTGGGNRRHGETLRSAETFENHRFHNGNFMLSTGNAIRPLRLGNAGVGKTEAAVVNGKGVRPAVPASKDFS